MHYFNEKSTDHDGSGCPRFPYLIGSFENSTPRGAGLAETGEILRARSEHVACVGMLHAHVCFRFDFFFDSIRGILVLPRQRLFHGGSARVLRRVPIPAGF